MTELGKRLKEAREAKKISLDELQDITKIQNVTYLALKKETMRLCQAIFMFGHLLSNMLRQ